MRLEALTVVSGEPVWRAYAVRADDYIELLGSIEATAPEDQHLIARWAAGINGLILDVGCGPGHWTHFLHGAGARVVGIDPVDRFLDSARQRYPGVPFRTGSASDLGEEDGTVAGVLAWYSLIHTPPEQLSGVFSALAGALRPGGSALLGFFEGPELVAFDHTVTVAWTWPVPELARWLAQAGLAVAETHTRTDPGQRAHGAVVATLP
ncbi:MAG TPA: class I SAM-dependent methyltransferase [Actinomycetaceae bacterium]|nr:class I SAM-dependent methyltransferase [Actinomycetaceae bacterium]